MAARPTSRETELMCQWLRRYTADVRYVWLQTTVHRWLGVQ